MDKCLAKRIENKFFPDWVSSDCDEILLLLIDLCQTTVAISERLGVTQSYVSKMARGKRRIATKYRAELIKMLGETVSTGEDVALSLGQGFPESLIIAKKFLRRDNQ